MRILGIECLAIAELVHRRRRQRLSRPFRFKFWIGVTIAWLPFVVVSIMAFLTANNLDEQLGGGLFAFVTSVAMVICLRIVRDASRYRLDYDDAGVRSSGTREDPSGDNRTPLTNETIPWDQIVTIGSAREVPPTELSARSGPQIVDKPNYVLKLRDGTTFIPLVFRDVNLVESPQFTAFREFAHRHNVHVSR